MWEEERRKAGRSCEADVGSAAERDEGMEGRREAEAAAVWAE